MYFASKQFNLLMDESFEYTTVSAFVHLCREPSLVTIMPYRPWERFFDWGC